MKWKDILCKVKNMQGKRPKSEKGIKNAVQRVTASGKKGVATTNYKNCGRKKALTLQETKMVINYVQKWRKKIFCTCPHIKRELKLDVHVGTIARTLNRHGYYWRHVPKKSPISEEHQKKRKTFVLKHVHHRPQWWVDNMHLVIDGVTLTKAPRKLSSRQKHAAQAIKALRMKKKEVMDPDLHTYQRYSLFSENKSTIAMRTLDCGFDRLHAVAFVISKSRVWEPVGHQGPLLGRHECCRWRCVEALDANAQDEEGSLGSVRPCVEEGSFPS